MTNNDSPEVAAMKRALAAADNSQTKMAVRLGISQQRIAYYLKNGATAEIAPDIEAAFGVPCEELCPAVNWAVLRRAQRRPTTA